MENLAFESGKIYTCNSICDSECVWHVAVLNRTEKFLTIKVIGEGYTKRVGMRVFQGEEQCLFDGSYSMAPRIRAGKVA